MLKASRPPRCSAASIQLSFLLLWSLGQAQDASQTSQQIISLLGQVPVSAATLASSQLSTLQPPQLTFIGQAVTQSKADKNAALCTAALSFGVDLGAKGFPCAAPPSPPAPSAPAPLAPGLCGDGTNGTTVFVSNSSVIGATQPEGSIFFECSGVSGVLCQNPDLFQYIGYCPGLGREMVCNHAVGMEEGVVLLVQEDTPPVNLVNSTLVACTSALDCPDGQFCDAQCDPDSDNCIIDAYCGDYTPSSCFPPAYDYL